MSEGKILEQGTHSELMAKQGAFAKMVSFDQSQKVIKHERNEDNSGTTSPTARVRKLSENSTKDVLQPFINEEKDVKESGWKVLLRYLEVSSTVHLWTILSVKMILKHLIFGSSTFSSLPTLFHHP